MTLWADRRGERDRRRAGAAADIEDALAGLRPGLALEQLRDLDIARLL